MLLSDLGIKEEFETVTNDFKRFLNDGGKSLEWLKTVDAFANTKGGTLYVGVSDEGYQPIGLDKKTVDAQVQLFFRLVKDHLRPEPVVQVRYLKVKDEAFVIEFSIASSLSKPVVCSYSGTGSIFVRLEGKTRLATTEEIQRMALDTAYVEYDKVYSDVEFDPACFRTLYSIYKENTSNELTEKALFSIGFFNEQRICRRAALLFSDDFQGDETALSITDFMGLGKGGNRFVGEPLFRGNILEGIKRVQDFAKAHSKEIYVKLDENGHTTSSFPERAVTEAIVNAYAHRNYLLPHGQIEVNLYLDRLEIVSPGSVVGRSGFEKKKDLAALIPIRRNPFICEVLSLLLLMERKGSGFDKIEKEYDCFSTAFKPFASSDEASFSISLPNLSYPFGVADGDNANLDLLFPKIEREKESTGGILSYCFFKRRSISEIASFLGVAVSSYLRNNVLHELIDRGLLILEKEGNKDYYLTDRRLVHIRGEGQ